MKIDPDDLSVDSIKILWYVCFHPCFNTKWGSTIVILNIFICCLYTTLAVIGILLAYNNDMFFMSECLQTCILMTHIIGKLLNLHVNRKALFDLLEKKAKFWKITDFETNSFHEDYLKIFNVIKNMLRFYFTLASSAALLFDLQPFTTGLLPTGCYVPDGSFFYLTVLLWYLSWIAVISLAGTDCLFCSLGTSVTVQFQLLAFRFKNLFNKTSDKKMWGELEKLVEYHNFLISYSEQLNITFQSIFLLQFVIAIASASVSVFIFMEPGAWSNRMKFAIYFLTVIIQTGFYCIPLEIVADEAQKIGMAVYNSKWPERNEIQFKKSLNVVISRSQKPLVFSGYGLLNMNLQTYVLICKTVFTFYTYLNSVRSLSLK